MMCLGPKSTISALLLCLLTTAATAQQQAPADLVLQDGKVITVDDRVPSASAIAIRGDRIIAVGSNDDMKPLIGTETKVIPLDGKLVTPGLIDSHAHLLGLGQSMRMIDLTSAKTYGEIVALVREKAKSSKPGEWIEGWGWHQDKWDSPAESNVNGLPTHGALSAVSPDNPVVLYHASGHMYLANVRVMELAAITPNTKSPDGGEITRDNNGLEIGIFQENATLLIDAAHQKSLSARTREEVAAANTVDVTTAMKYCAANGITTFHDAGETFDNIDLLTRLAQENKLPIRLWVMIGDSTHLIKKQIGDYPRVGLGNNHLTIRAVKQYADGALGSRGGWLLEPYTDLPWSTGQNLTPLDSIEEIARLAAAHGLQLCTHAIGDRANREILDLYERVLKNYPDRKDRRWRIEHAQHIHPIDLPRFAQLGVIAAMQGVHCTSDGLWVPVRLGEQRAIERSYVWHDLLESGAVVVNGTDSPVENINPLACFYSSITRRLSDGTVFAPKQRMTREEALRSYTISAAYAAFEEDLKGSIIPGKLADIVVFSKDIMTIPENEIPSTKVVYTIVGGKVIFQQ